MKLSKSVLIAIIAVVAIIISVIVFIVSRHEKVSDIYHTSTDKATPTFIKLPPRLRNNCAVPV